MPMSAVVATAFMIMVHRNQREAWMKKAILYLWFVEMDQLDIDLNHFR